MAGASRSRTARAPRTPGAFQTTYGGNGDAFVTKLNAAGSALVYSTYLGGSVEEDGDGIAVDASRNAYVTGFTASSNFPSTPGAFQATFGGDADAFISKLNPAGSALVYSTYLGGRVEEDGDGIAVDASRNAYVTGSTNSSNFPTTPGTFQTTYGSDGDAFVTKENPTGSFLLFSTYLGGSGNDQGNGITVDASGDAYVTGYTGSSNFPTTSGAFRTSLTGVLDAYVAKIALAGAPGPFTILANFDGNAGSSPNFVALAQGLDGNLYGTASQGETDSQGTVFKVTPAGSLTAIYNFDCTHGAAPYAGLVLGIDDNFYGTTYEGGTNGYGTVFKIAPSGVLTTLHSFRGSDGAYPEAALVQGTDGRFYGTTSQGGANGLGTIFRIGSRGLFATVHSFQYLPQPVAGLVEGTDGNFYGATAYGGTGAGVVFKISPDGELTSLHEFDRTDGAHPEAALVEGSDGKFYGTTAAGGASGNGTVFRLIGGFTSLASFDGSILGSMPVSPLVQATDGNFYGTASGGGACGGNGTIFKFTPAGAATLHSFCGTDGSGPDGGLVQHTNGTLYGVTMGGGTNSLGAIFSLNVELDAFVKTLPTSAVLGAPVTILGTNLAGTTSVSFNGTPAAFTVVSSSEITTTVPADATTGQVQVVTPGGTLLSNVNFGVAPSISGFSPASGPVGTSVVITGQSFIGVTRVAFGGGRRPALR